MLEGKIVKAAGGFFTVRSRQGEDFVCRARGMLKRGSSDLMVGDLVVFEPAPVQPGGDCGDGIIEKLLPRSNQLYRPPVANVDQIIIVMSLKEPECDWQLVSRMLVLAEKENLKINICLNKADLAGSGQIISIQEKLKPFPYPLFFTNAREGTGIEHLRKILDGNCSVFAGPSGVGKSSLLNAVQPGLALQTGVVSDKIKRGKHTTRQAELLTIDSGGSVFDTPGFTRLEFSDILPADLSSYFPEFESLLGQCTFRDCTHLSEPGCAVLKEVGNSVNPMRYEHYKYFSEELNKQEGY